MEPILKEKEWERIKENPYLTIRRMQEFIKHCLPDFDK